MRASKPYVDNLHYCACPGPVGNCEDERSHGSIRTQGNHVPFRTRRRRADARCRREGSARNADARWWGGLWPLRRWRDGGQGRDERGWGLEKWELERPFGGKGTDG